MTRFLDDLWLRVRVGDRCWTGAARMLSGVALALAVGVAPVAHAGVGTTVVLSASKDNTLYESATGALSNGSGDSFFAGTTGTDLIRRGLLAFDIASAIPAGSVITNVELILQMTRTVSGSNTVSSTGRSTTSTGVSICRTCHVCSHASRLPWQG